MGDPRIRPDTASGDRPARDREGPTVLTERAGLPRHPSLVRRSSCRGEDCRRSAIARNERAEQEWTAERIASNGAQSVVIVRDRRQQRTRHHFITNAADCLHVRETSDLDEARHRFERRCQPLDIFEYIPLKDVLRVHEDDYATR